MRVELDTSNSKSRDLERTERLVRVDLEQLAKRVCTLMYSYIYTIYLQQRINPL